MAKDPETFSATFQSLFWSSLMLIGHICTRQQFTAKGVNTLFLTHGAEDGWRVKAAFADMNASAAMRQVNNWMQGIHQYLPDRSLMIAHNVLVSLSEASSIVTSQDRQTATSLDAKILAFHHPPSQTPPRTGQHQHVLAAAQSHWHSRHFSSAVHRAYEALLSAVKDKSGRHDLDGRDLIFHVFNEDKPMLLATL